MIGYDSFNIFLFSSCIAPSIILTVFLHLSSSVSLGSLPHAVSTFSSMRNPLVRQYIKPVEIIKSIRYKLEGFHLGDDARFDYNIPESSSMLNFKLAAKI